ncbi:hypothetical protein [Streptomyces marokkonensis]|nr:hypothetical protein [Streptomyces marokkonensis]
MSSIHGQLSMKASGDEVPEKRWKGATVRHYRAADPSRLIEDVPLYTL